MKPKLFLLTVFCLLCLCFNAFAQQRFTLKASIKDATTGEQLSFVTVVVAKPGADKPTAYALSEENGSITVSDLRPAKYYIKAEYLGYKPFQKDFEIKDADVDLGEIKLEPDSELLNAAKVSSVGNPIQMKSDTIAFTASSSVTSHIYPFASIPASL